MLSHNPRRLFCLIVLASVGFLAGCSHSKNPISDPAKARPDERLIGAWQCHVERGVTFWFIRQSAKANSLPGEMELIDVGLLQDGKLIALSGSTAFFVSHIGDSHYINLPNTSEDDQKQKKVDYGFWRYAVEGDQLTVWMKIDDKVVVSAIERGELKGDIKGEGGHKWGEIADTTENLSRFISKSDPDVLFEPGWKAVFTRVQSPR